MIMEVSSSRYIRVTSARPDHIYPGTASGSSIVLAVNSPHFWTLTTTINSICPRPPSGLTCANWSPLSIIAMNPMHVVPKHQQSFFTAISNRQTVRLSHCLVHIPIRTAGLTQVDLALNSSHESRPIASQARRLWFVERGRGTRMGHLLLRCKST
jgi:hypothetical protein